ncbi:MAG: C39 family peptidase [Lachnospiraceae bacterium]|nr:C39 family peptidase [Lachnospiraceae bacterium]
MPEKNKQHKKDGILPVIFWIFFIATVAVLLILTGTLLSRNGTLNRWKAQYTAWKEEREAEKRAESAGEKTVHYFGPAGIAEYESWFAGEWLNAPGADKTDGEHGTAGNGEHGAVISGEDDPLRQALTASPVNGSEDWWSKAKKVAGTVTLYAQAGVPLYNAPQKTGTICGYGSAGEEFRLFAVFEDGWYVVSDGRFYYCTEGEHYTMIRPETVDFEAVSSGVEKKKVFHEVETILQKPELPHGCEVTGLAMLLRYYGVSADKCVLAERWLPKGAWGETDFRKAFVGDPKKTVASAGCYASVIGDVANRYLQKTVSRNGKKEKEGNDERNSLTAVAKEGLSFAELLSLVEESPVLAWTTMELKAPYIAQVWTVDDEELYWQNYEHCVVLTGYDLEKEILYGTDPLYGPCEYDMKLFSLRFQTMYSQAVWLTEEEP